MRDSQPALCFCCITLSQHFDNSPAVAEVVCVLARTTDNDTGYFSSGRKCQISLSVEALMAAPIGSLLTSVGTNKQGRKGTIQS